MVQEAHANVKIMLAEVWQGLQCCGRGSVCSPPLMSVQPSNKDNFLLHGLSGLLAFYLWRQRRSSGLSSWPLCVCFCQVNSHPRVAPLPTRVSRAAP